MDKEEVISLLLLQIGVVVTFVIDMCLGMAIYQIFIAIGFSDPSASALSSIITIILILLQVVIFVYWLSLENAKGGK